MNKSRSGRGQVARIALFIALTCFARPELSIAQVVENPLMPKAPNAGRVIVPKEVMAISDHSRKAYSPNLSPRNPRVMPNGSLLVSTRLPICKLLPFDKDGRFIRDLLREGRWPGDLGCPGGYLLTGNNIIVLAGNPEKLLWFDSAGKYERETPLYFSSGKYTPLAFLDGTFYISYGTLFGFQGISILQGEPRIFDIPWDIFTFKESSCELKPLVSFPIRRFFKGCVKFGEYSAKCGWSTINSFISVPFQEKYMVLSHTSEYLLKIYNPASNTVIREFRRAYERVKRAPEKGDMTIDGKPPNIPDLNYENDIVNVFTSGDDIYAVTSTRDSDKGVLIDLFDGSGIYKDSFYLKLPAPGLNALMDPERSTLDGNALYIIFDPESRDDMCVIRKYLIEK